ncbi:MAG: DUF3168 domain-containing protein [Pelagibacterium sp.]|uniref:tail completion protein gp17 n=1 Tax=Pelagibacterium sp. TaxID=1967288 RepID=UPI0032EB8DE6
MSATEIAMRILRGDPGVIAYVSGRVYPGVAPQDVEPPYIVVSLISEEQDVVLNGHLDGYDSRVSFAIVAPFYNLANAIGEEVKACFSGVVHREMTIDEEESPPPTVAVTAFKTSADFIDHNEARTNFRRIQDFRIRWARQ